MAFHAAGRDKLVKFWNRHAQARRPLEAWLAEATAAHWQTPQDFRDRYPAASFLGEHRVVFNMKGKDDRLLVAVFLARRHIVIEQVGTHTEYDRWNL